MNNYSFTQPQPQQIGQPPPLMAMTRLSYASPAMQQRDALGQTSTTTKLFWLLVAGGVGFWLYSEWLKAGKAPTKSTYEEYVPSTDPRWWVVSYQGRLLPKAIDSFKTKAAAEKAFKSIKDDAYDVPVRMKYGLEADVFNKKLARSTVEKEVRAAERKAGIKRDEEGYVKRR